MAKKKGGMLFIIYNYLIINKFQIVNLKVKKKK